MIKTIPHYVEDIVGLYKTSVLRGDFLSEEEVSDSLEDSINYLINSRKEVLQTYRTCSTCEHEWSPTPEWRVVWSCAGSYDLFEYPCIKCGKTETEREGDR